jgi:deazaflavin-dependent oxidoreductase (nitroreductase family)
MSSTDEIKSALTRDGTIDITTTGARSGEPRRIEIVFFVIDSRIYISGFPGKRAWLANLSADPNFVFNLKRRAQADLPATARVIADEPERRAILGLICKRWNRENMAEEFIADAPLIEVTLEDETLLAA